MSLSVTVAKGAGIISGVVGLPVAAVCIHNYATSLYEVEKKVIENNVQLKKSDDSRDGNLTLLTVKNTTPTTDGFVNLPDGYSWSCKITIDPHTEGQTTNLSGNLWDKLKKNLPSEDAPTQNKDAKLKNKELLVRACASDRETTGLSNKTVVGKLTIKETAASGASFEFKQNPELSVLLTTA